MLTSNRLDFPGLIRHRLLSLVRLLCLTLVFAASQASAETRTDESVAGAMQALDDFMQAFNSRNMETWATTLNYPHVRFASGEVVVFDNAAQFSDRQVFKYLTENGWDHSAWVKRDVTMTSASKVHVSTVFERFDKNNMSIGTYESLYIVTKANGRWGVKARSSLAP